MKNRASRARVRPNKAKPPCSLNRQLTLEQLEDRRLLANVTVSNLSDVVNGNVMSIAKLLVNDGHDGISLREAIQAANNTAGADTIDFAASISSSTINLLSQLQISDALTIDASALSGELKLDAGNGFDHQRFTGDGFRVLNIDDGDANNQSAVQLLGLKLTGGDRYGDGGAILNRENLTITGCSIVVNGASSRGGGIFNVGTTRIIDSTVTDNWGGFAGGGIFNGGNLEVVNSTISGNRPATYGGGVYNNGDGIATILGSTLRNNYGYYGGAIYNQFNGTMTIANSTISGNTAGWSGGGMENHGTASVTRSTFTANLASYGGGIVNGNILDLTGNIIAENTALGFEDLEGFAISGAYNLVGTGGLEDGVDGNQVGSSDSPLDPLLGPLQDNGGPTLTHALLPGSPAINGGDPGFAPPPDFDQRGAPYARVVGGRIDIGAFETQAVITPSADFDDDGDIDGRDFLLWQRGFGTPAPGAVKTDGDADNDLDVDQNDLNIWQLQYGTATPEVALVRSAEMFEVDTPTLSSESIIADEVAATVAIRGLIQISLQESGTSNAPTSTVASTTSLLSAAQAWQRHHQQLPQADKLPAREAAFAELFASVPRPRPILLPTTPHEFADSELPDVKRYEGSDDFFWLADEVLEAVFR